MSVICSTGSSAPLEEGKSLLSHFLQCFQYQFPLSDHRQSVRWFKGVKAGLDLLTPCPLPSPRAGIISHLTLLQPTLLNWIVLMTFQRLHRSYSLSLSPLFLVFQEKVSLSNSPSCPGTCLYRPGSATASSITVCMYLFLQ